jgi:hypothetical protein
VKELTKEYRDVVRSLGYEPDEVKIVGVWSSTTSKASPYEPDTWVLTISVRITPKETRDE